MKLSRSFGVSGPKWGHICFQSSSSYSFYELMWINTSNKRWHCGIILHPHVGQQFSSIGANDAKFLMTPSDGHCFDSRWHSKFSYSKCKNVSSIIVYSCLKFSPHSTLFSVHSLNLLGSTKELKMVDWCHPVLGVSLSPSQVSDLSPYLLASCIKAVLQWAPTGSSILLADHRCHGNTRCVGTTTSVLNIKPLCLLHRPGLSNQCEVRLNHTNKPF